MNDKTAEFTSTFDSLEKSKFLLRLPFPKKRYLWGMTKFLLGNSALHQLGWFKSVWKETPIDSMSRPLPWMTYSSIYFLDKVISKELNVFEYGSGNSTLWWAKRVKSVTSVENDKSWYETIRSNMPSNVELMYKSLDNGYSNSILNSENKYDIIVVDGRERVECALVGVTVLSESGVIIWDNSNRKRYQTGIDELKSKGFRRLDFFGLVPQSNKVGLTSIFYRSGNCMGI